MKKECMCLPPLKDTRLRSKQVPYLALAATALRFFGGDLGGGYFPGVEPALRFDAVGALAYGLLGVVAALVGGWLPARSAERIAPAQALKGLGLATATRAPWRLGLALVALGAALALLPPVFEIPLAAYVSVALLLISAFSDSAIGGYLVGSLPLAGVNGTLADRMRKPPAYRNVRAKTGTTDAASALSGYVRSRYVFAILMNGSPIPWWYARQAQDRFAQVLAGQ
jgi:hypothetical protein